VLWDAFVSKGNRDVEGCVTAVCLIALNFTRRRFCSSDSFKVVSGSGFCHSFTLVGSPHFEIFVILLYAFFLKQTTPAILDLANPISRVVPGSASVLLGSGVFIPRLLRAFRL
jgi:hypothetical protein